MDIGKIIRKARLDAGLTMKTVEAETGIIASNQSKIELGENKAPGFVVVAKLATLYGLSLDGVYNAMVDHGGMASIAAQTKACVQLPILSWVQAGAWSESLSDNEPNVVASPFKCSSDAYAMVVNGDSMTSQHGALKSFPDGSLIVVDPNVEAINKSFVVARMDGSNEATFKQLIVDGDRKYLKPLNTQYPLINIDQPIDICGVVLGKIEESTI